MTSFRLPDSVPMLSQGKHRNPRKGACFMEMASFLAGERWSDHPNCTHPLLASLARLVNDNTSDAGRQELVVMIPSVIGLTSDDPHVDAQIAQLAATTALPVVAAERQCVMAVSVLACDRVLAELDDRPVGQFDERSRSALAQAPRAAEWADAFTRGVASSLGTFRRHAAPRIVRSAVEGIASACVLEPDRVLRDLLAEAIEETMAIARGADTTVPDQVAPAVNPPAVHSVR